MNGTDNEHIDLHDVHLRHALDHAPDQNAVPDWRWRKAILKKAHDAVGEPDPEDAEADLERAAQSWWQRMGSGESHSSRGKSRKPLYALIATLMIALVTVMLWRRDPARGPSIDSQVAARAPSPEESIPIPKSTPTDTASIPLLPPSFFEKPQLPEPRPMPPIQPSAVVPKPAPPIKSASAPASPPSAAPGTASASKDQKTPPQGASLKPPLSPQQPQQQQQQQREATQASPPAASVPPAAPQPGRADSAEPPTFDALLQWNRITITGRDGETRSLPRTEAREVSALMASAALSAVGPQPMKGAPEWRVTLERGADQLAVLEVSGSQVRWREGRTPAATGTPSAGSISALREALSNAVKEPQAPPGEPPRSP